MVSSKLSQAQLCVHGSHLKTKNLKINSEFVSLIMLIIRLLYRFERGIQKPFKFLLERGVYPYPKEELIKHPASHPSILQLLTFIACQRKVYINYKQYNNMLLYVLLYCFNIFS